jgi:hypothetical protein
MCKLCVNLLTIVLMTTGVVTAQYRTFELKPIQKQGWRYYYDFKKLSTPEALQIPLLAMEDDQIRRYYNTFAGLQTASSVVFLAPLLYVVSQANATSYSPDTFWALTIGSFAASLALQIWSHNRMKLAVERYNLLLLPHPTGREPVGNGGLRLTFRL